jgi:hypothetical protein
VLPDLHCRLELCALLDAAKPAVGLSGAVAEKAIFPQWHAPLIFMPTSMQ